MPPQPDNSMVTASSENPAVVWVRWWRGARLVATVVLLFIVAEALRLAPQTWLNTPPTPTVEATATALGPSELTSPPIVAVTAASDLASLDLASIDAAEATARAAVERYEASSAAVFKSIRATRVGAASFVDGRPQYDAEVRVEIPRAVGKPIRRSYFLTVEYVGGGGWEIERAMFATTH
jgi:hypothetical protein